MKENIQRVVSRLGGQPERFRGEAVLYMAVGCFLLFVGVFSAWMSLAEPRPGFNTLSGFTFMALGLGQISLGTSKLLYKKRIRLTRIAGMLALLFSVCAVLGGMGVLYWISELYGVLTGVGVIALIVFVVMVFGKRNAS